MIKSMRALIGVATLLSTACTGEPPKAVTDSSRVAVQAAPFGNADSPKFERTRIYDLDGDGADETITVYAEGPRWEAMRVYVTIRSPAGTILYTDTFSTTHYLGLDPDTSMSRQAKDSTIKATLGEILSDNSFVPTAENFDSDNVSLESQAGVTAANLEEVRKDLMRRPMFRYYVGGETSTGITWSSVLRRFVETSICC
jgi:hypothetical protein